MEQKDNHFNQIFWLLAGSLFCAFVYVFLITFYGIPKENIRFADTALGFFLGTLIGNIISYFVGGSPQTKKPETPAGTTTADISATITSNPPNEIQQ